MLRTREWCVVLGLLFAGGCAANPDDEVKQGYQAYHEAIRSGDADKLKELLTQSNAGEVDDPKKLEILKDLVPPTVDIEEVKVEGQTATLKLSTPMGLKPGRPPAPGSLRPAQVLKGHQAEVDSLACTSDGNYLITASSGDYSVRVWSLSSGVEVSQVTLKSRPTCVRMDDAIECTGVATMRLENGRWKLEKEDWTVDADSRLLIADRGRVTAWPLMDGVLGTGVPLSAEGECVAVSPDGKRLASTSFDKPVVVDGKDLGESWVRRLAFDPTGRFLAGVGRGNEVVLWKTSDGSKRKVRMNKVSQEVDAGGLAFSADGNRLAVSMLDTSVVVLDANSGKELLNSYVTDVSMWDACFLADGDTLATAGNNGDVYLWSISKGKRVGQLKGHQDAVRSLALSPDGQTLISGSEDRNVILWRADADPVAVQDGPPEKTPAPAPRVDPDEGQILGQRNLVRNPRANQGTARWRKDGEATVEDGRFTVRHGGSFYQDVVLPPALRGGVVVLVARSSSERVDPDGDITGLPYLYGYLMESEEKITDYLQGDTMRCAATETGVWVPVWGVYDLPASTTRVRVFLNQASGGSSPTDSAARFDDVGVLVFPDRSAADHFVAQYRQQP